MKPSPPGVSPARAPEKPPVAVGGIEVPPLAAGGGPEGGTWPAAGAVGASDLEGAVAMAQHGRRGRRREAGRKEKAQDLISRYHVERILGKHLTPNEGVTSII